MTVSNASLGGVLIIPVLLVLLVTFFRGFGINQEYQRAVVYRLGRLKGVKGPGVFWMIPWLERFVRVDIRTITVSLATQETITKDGLAVKVNATLWYQVTDPRLAVNAVINRDDAILQAAETALRDTIGQHALDDLLKDRMSVNAKLMDLLSRGAAKWGIEIDAVEIRDLDIPETMQRALAREAEASREARARLIKAQGEEVAAATLVRAAEAIAAAPGALELRRLQTLTEIGAEHNSTIIVAMPMELLSLGKRASD